MRKELKVIRHNKKFTGKHLGQSYDYCHNMGITLEGEPKLLATIANEITEIVWNDYGYSAQVMSGGRQYPDKMRVFIMQNGIMEYQYEKVQYSKAVLAIYGILASYGVKIQ